MSGVTWRIGAGTAAAQLQATADYADEGPANAQVLLFSTARHTPLDGANGDTPMVVVELAKPCAVIAGSVLTLQVADPDGALVLATGIPRWGLWVNGAGEVVAEGSVTDGDHTGDIQVLGGTTLSGDDSPLLQAGGLVLLGATSLT